MNSAGLRRSAAVSRRWTASLDCGVKQDIAVFEHNTLLPLSVSVLIDISGSTAKDLPYEVTSITKFLKALLIEGNTIQHEPS